MPEATATSATTTNIVAVSSTTRRNFTPDIARVAVTISGDHDTREACLEEFNTRYEAVCRGLLAAGVAADAITTEHFFVNMRQRALYLPYEHGGGYYWCKQVADGYEYNGQLSIKAPADAELVGRIWLALNDCGDGVTFNISYDLANPDAARTELMSAAVEEALAKARILASGAGRTIGETLRISFGSDLASFARPMEYGVRNAKMFAMAEDCAAGSAPSLTPRNIEIACDVHVECELA